MTVVNRMIRRQNVPYIYILMNGVPCELSHTVSRFGGTREQRRVRASLLSSVPRAPCASFSRKNKKKVRQLENVPRRVYTPTFAPSLPKNTVTYHQVHYFEKGAGEQSSAARTKTKIATVGKSMPSLSQSAPAADPNANAASSNSSSRSIAGKKTQSTAPKRW